jgi:acyl carrier protein
MQKDEVRAVVREYICKEYMFDDSKDLNDHQSLLGSGVIDSTGILDLIGYLQQKFEVEFLDSELVAENFDSVDQIVEFLLRRKQ